LSFIEQATQFQTSLARKERAACSKSQNKQDEATL
jgi:hypothetical protein